MGLIFLYVIKSMEIWQPLSVFQSIRAQACSPRPTFLGLQKSSKTENANLRQKQNSIQLR